MAAQPRFQFQFKGNFIGGQFLKARDTSGEWVLKSPANFADEVARISYSYSSVDEAVRSAREGFARWRKTPQADRAELLKKYQAALKKREDELMEAIAREVGKPLWEAKTEFTAMINKVDITINESVKLVADYEIPKIMEGTTGACRYRPLGVMAVIGPFNFPGHLPNGHIAPALLTGNTVVFKPSEKAPIVGQIMAECFQEAGFPPGVFNLLQGEREVGRRLVVHEGVDGVLFTGSYEVGTRIKQDTLQQHWKLLALEMGGKNATVVWEDADLESAIQETLVSAFVSAGQRCSATSRVIVHAQVYDQFLSRFHERAKAFSIGHPLDNPFMGPLIDQGSVDRYMKFLGIASREGAEVIMRGKQLETGYTGNYVAPSICAVQDCSIEAARKSIYQQTEFFAPNLAVLRTEDLAHAVGLANVTQYGLAASVFTRSRETYGAFLEDLEAGIVNWNKSTVGASSRLPFGGLKKSGNHFPTALSAALYCTYPLASLEVEQPKPAAATAYPGLNWA
jgi:succinylglutamic semialdehyde dehydrogenase